MTLITPPALPPAEQEIVDAAERGDWADLSHLPAVEQRVRAPFLRDLLLHLRVVPDPSTVRPCHVRLPGVRVRGARIDDDLNLADCVGPSGNGLPVLALENCEINAKIDLTNARLARLSLKDSRIGEVAMRGAKLDGLFDFSGVKPGSKSPYAWIDAHGCVVHGDVLGDGAKLRTPPARDKVRKGRQRYALRLSNSVIEGSLFLMGSRYGTGSECDPFEAIGGVSISTAHIHGDIAGLDAHMVAIEQDAFRAQASIIDGAVMLGGMNTSGRVWMLGVRIGAGMEFGGARLTNDGSVQKGDALIVTNAEIRGDLLLNEGFTAEGCVCLTGTKVGGSLDCSGASLSHEAKADDEAEDDTGYALYAADVRIGGEIRLNGVTAIGLIVLHGARIGGDLTCGAATFIAPPTASRFPARRESALDATNLTAGGDVKLYDTQVIGDLVFEHAEITGSLYWFGLSFPREATAPFHTFSQGVLVRKHVRGSYHRPVDISAKEPLEPEDRMSPMARIVLAHAHIGAALQAHYLIAEVSLVIDLSAARVYTLDDDLSRGGEVKDVPPFPAGWGGASGDWAYPRQIEPHVDLDGFVYQRIENFPPTPLKDGEPWQRLLHALLNLIGLLLTPVRRLLAHLCAPLKDTSVGQKSAESWKRLSKLAGRENIANKRLEWLERQFDSGAGTFFPQPYRHLATVMRNQGHVDAARKVAIREAKLTPYGLAYWPRRLFFGCPFGYGLSPTRAICTLFLLWLLGSKLVSTALLHSQADTTRLDAGVLPVLVLTPERVATKVLVLRSENLDKSGIGQDPAGKYVDTADIPCRANEIRPPLYAVDMMLPVIPLHQEDRCEVAARADTRWWQYAWAGFSIIGKLMVSIALITFSGVLKPKDD